ncbi:MAG: hypothetical protein GX456_19870 [Verrucomicrobia bacterium]|nr:hypothetical protein [Verrucomicrobiota bacterium]
MDVTHQTSFDALLQAVKSKAPGSLKTADIKRLLKATGKRPTETQANQIADMIAASPRNHALVYDLLCDLETSAKPNPKVVMLKPALWRIALSWFSSPPPAGQELEPMLAWLRSQCERPADDRPVSGDRIRGVLLALIALYRSPDTFLKCLREIGPFMGEALKLVDKKRAPRHDSKSGFVMQYLARALYAAGKGGHPKLAKVVEIVSTVETVMTHLREKESTADAAIRKLEQLEGALTEQRRINSEQAETIRKMEREKEQMQTQMNELTAEVSKWKQLHEQAVSHTGSAVAEGSKTLLNDLSSKIRPKLGDARLYVNRPTPAVDQVLRLLGEIEEVLGTKEDQP